MRFSRIALIATSFLCAAWFVVLWGASREPRLIEIPMLIGRDGRAPGAAYRDAARREAEELQQERVRLSEGRSPAPSTSALLVAALDQLMNAKTDRDKRSARDRTDVLIQLRERELVVEERQKKPPVYAISPNLINGQTDDLTRWSMIFAGGSAVATALVALVDGLRYRHERRKFLREAAEGRLKPAVAEPHAEAVVDRLPAGTA